nr:unnamed protein product [Spirometra erinaceieuropaei]
MGPSRSLKLGEARFPPTSDDRVSRESFQAWLSGPRSPNIHSTVFAWVWSRGNEWANTTPSESIHNLRSDRLERITALVARKLARYKVRIATFSRTRFAEQGQLETGAGYSFWSGRLKAERRGAGVAFAIRNDTVGRLSCLPQDINDRLMSLRLPLRGGKFATIISVYAFFPLPPPNDQV